MIEEKTHQKCNHHEKNLHCQHDTRITRYSGALPVGDCDNPCRQKQKAIDHHQRSHPISNQFQQWRNPHSQSSRQLTWFWHCCKDIPVDHHEALPEPGATQCIGPPQSHTPHPSHRRRNVLAINIPPPFSNMYPPCIPPERLCCSPA